MEGQPTISRGSWNAAAASPEYTASPLLLQSPTSSPISPNEQTLVLSYHTEGKVRVFWKLPLARNIPVHPEYVSDRQSRSQTFETGDKQTWLLKCNRNLQKTHIGLFLQKHFPQPDYTRKDYKAMVTTRLHRGSEELDRFTKMLTFSTVHPNNGFGKALAIEDEDDTFIVEMTISPNANNENSRIETLFVGLHNEGNTCYINALLQTLYHIPSFRQAVFQVRDRQIPSTPYRNCVAFCLQKVFYDLMNSRESVSIKHLMESLEVSDECKQEDVHEFSLLFYEKLISAMKDSPVADFIPSLLEGQTETLFRCKHVPYTSEPRVESFIDLTLSVSDSINIEQSLKKLCEEEMTGENQFDAEHFGKQDAVRQVKFKRLPPVLQVFLKRFDYNNGRIEKINDLFQFPEFINLSPYLCEPGEAQYQLFSILVHKGFTNAGHYFAFIKTNLSEWFKFNDHSVDKVAPWQVWLSSFGGSITDHVVRNGGIEAELIDNDMSAYMLCYIRTAEKRHVLKPTVLLSAELEGMLKKGHQERQAVVVIPSSPSRSLLTKEFDMPFLSMNLVKAWKGPGIFFKGDKPLVPNEINLETKKVPMGITASELSGRLKKEMNDKNVRLWLFYPRVSDWQFRQLRPDTSLYQALSDNTQILFIETEGNIHVPRINIGPTCARLPDDAGDRDTVPDDPISPPLKWDCEKTLVFLKAYKYEWGQGELILSSAANINEEVVSVDEVKRYMLKEVNNSQDSCLNRLYIERCSKSIMEQFDCVEITEANIATKKTQGAVLVANGDALILDLSANVESKVTPDDFLKKLVYYTTASFSPVSPSETKDSLIDLNEKLGSKAEFQEEILQASTLHEITYLLIKRLSPLIPGLTVQQLGVYYFDKNARSMVRWPFPVNLSDSGKNPRLEALLCKKLVKYGVDKPRENTDPDIEVSIFYVDEKQVWNAKPILRTLPSNCTVKDLRDSIFEEVSEIWKCEKGETMPSQIEIFEHDAGSQGYLHNLKPFAKVKALIEKHSVFSVKVARPEEIGKKVCCVVFSEAQKKYFRPRYVVVTVRNSQEKHTCADVLNLVRNQFLPVEVIKVDVVRMKPPLEISGPLEPSNSIYVRSYSSGEAQLLVVIGS